MKKVVWIYSIMINQDSGLFGHGTRGVGRKARRFQENLKAELRPEIDLQFISYNIMSNEIPSADLILYNNLDSRDLSDSIKKVGLALSFRDIYLGDIEKIKNDILTYFDKTSSVNKNGRLHQATPRFASPKTNKQKYSSAKIHSADRIDLKKIDNWPTKLDLQSRS